MEHIDIDLKKYQTHLQTFTGINESNLKLIEQLGDVQIHYDTEKLSIVGEHASESKRLIQTAFQVIERYCRAVQS